MVEGRFDLGRLNYIFYLRVRIIFNAHLLVALSANCDADLQLTRHLSKVLRLWVAHNDPLVKQCVVGLLIQVAEIKLVVTDQSVLKEALVHEFDFYFSLL